jgi:hypothetical protein
MPKGGEDNIRSSLIDRILDREQEMFRTVRSRYPAPCQADPRGFRIHRSAQFSVWSEEALRSYLNDLEQAAKEDRNLMTLKYARMENLIPELHRDPEVVEWIDRIVSVQLKWQKALSARYPGLLGRGRPLEGDASGATSFSTYLRGELETYSRETLGHLFREVTGAEASGRNLTEGVYLTLVRGLGYGSIDDAEARIRQGKA